MLSEITFCRVKPTNSMKALKKLQDCINKLKCNSTVPYFLAYLLMKSPTGHNK